MNVPPESGRRFRVLKPPVTNNIRFGGKPIITRKQYPNHHVFETEIGGRAFTVHHRSGRRAVPTPSASAATATPSCSPPSPGDPMPPRPASTTSPSPSTSRSGCIPWAASPAPYHRREGRPLRAGRSGTAVIIDRPMRPLLRRRAPQRRRRHLHRSLSNDNDNPVEVVASLGAFHRHRLLRRALERPRGHHPASPIWTASMSSTPPPTSATRAETCFVRHRLHLQRRWS